MTVGMRGLLLAAVAALAIALPAPAHAAGPRVLKFACSFGDGRTHVLGRSQEAGSDDALYCWVQLGGVSELRAGRLSGELLAVRGGRRRPLVFGDFEPRMDRYHQASVELAVPHEAWFPLVDWGRGRRPRLHLRVRIYDKRSSPERRRWQPVLAASTDVGHHRVHAGTPSFKDAYAPRSTSPRHWSGFAAHMSDSPAPSPYDGP
jgi:hypothetical protein